MEKNQISLNQKKNTDNFDIFRGFFSLLGKLCNRNFKSWPKFFETDKITYFLLDAAVDHEVH